MSRDCSQKKPFAAKGKKQVRFGNRRQGSREAGALEGSFRETGLLEKELPQLYPEQLEELGIATLSIGVELSEDIDEEIESIGNLESVEEPIKEGSTVGYEGSQQMAEDLLRPQENEL
ncbi:hypothetical protein sscle_06g049840 [Sclerotinia sclerotiorum 1980 UF-70]|nr:hypothetical protein sscle_06g049840 [Sclerotinia sclerotiorum 1980 UF-70]